MTNRLTDARIGVVGATGLVGRELVGILDARGCCPEALHLFASKNTEIETGGRLLYASPIDLSTLRACDVVFLTATSDIARRVVDELTDVDALIVDNSSAFRLDPRVPLVIPEVNGDAAAGRLIANPNCSTILLLLALAPLHKAFGCSYVNVSTYQAVSGAGALALANLLNDTRDWLSEDCPRDRSIPASNAGRAIESRAFNVWSHESPVDPETGRNEEEQKILSEVARILEGGPELSVTCIRVPVERAHGESLTITFRAPVFEADVRAVLNGAAGISVCDDRSTGRFPTVRDATGRDDVLVGRIRPDGTAHPDGSYDRFQLWLTGDQLRKGAALNAVQVAEIAPKARTTCRPRRLHEVFSGRAPFDSQPS